MKFTLSWLKKHLETTASLEQITTTLTALGLEVEGVEDPAAKLAPFTVCYVKEAKQHPNADRLRVCQLDTKFGPVQVVCGAPNARTGMKGVFAPDGSFIPGSNITLKAGAIRGEMSNGMLVSEREMGLSEEHNGIIEVADDVAIGTPLAEVLGLNDAIIEIKLTPNRADCAGVRGIARDLAAAGLGTLKPLDAAPVKGSFKSPLAVELQDNTACPLFIGRYFRGVKNGPSPKWLQDALKAIGLRPISALVDITNYFTYDLPRPLHVFDADKVAGGKLTVSLAKGGETFAALNDKTYTLDAGMTVISDANGVESLGGIMGGAHSGCSETTTNVFLEVALFDPVRTAKTGRLLQVMSDARYRFERGLDPAMVQEYTELASKMILELCGGEASELVVAGAVPEWQRQYTLRADRCKTLGGVDVPWTEQVKILTTLGFTVAGQTVSPPSWRADIQGEADLVEEVLRVKGFDSIPATPLERTSVITKAGTSARGRKLAVARRTLATRGLLEAVTYSFMAKKHAELFGDVSAEMVLANPIAEDLNVMRPSVLPNLILAAGRNADRGFGDVALFEAGPVFGTTHPNLQAMMISSVRRGAMVPRQWAGGAREVDVFDAKADALAALEALGVPTAGLQVTTDAPAYYHPGQSGCLRLGKDVLANFGTVHPGTLEVLGLKGAFVGCEVFVERLPQARKTSGTAKPHLTLSSFQPVERDFAFVVGEGVTAEKLVKAVKGAEKELVTDVRVFDDYRGKGMAAGQKSLAVSITLQPVDKTLTEAEIEAVGQKVIAAVAKAVGGTIRA